MCSPCPFNILIIDILQFLCLGKGARVSVQANMAYLPEAGPTDRAKMWWPQGLRPVPRGGATGVHPNREKEQLNARGWDKIFYLAGLHIDTSIVFILETPAQVQSPLQTDSSSSQRRDPGLASLLSTGCLLGVLLSRSSP